MILPSLNTVPFIVKGTFIMMIRQDFSSELPPKLFLMQIMDNLGRLYCFLWEKKDKLCKLEFTWSQLKKHYNKNAFMTGLRKLNHEGLLNYETKDDGISIELVSWDEIDQ
jgi:hypothetical protein